MQWMNPVGAWAFLGMAAVLCLYLLKQRMEPVRVSSTYLWRRAVAAMEASHPFQKLRRNLLFFVQMLLALLLALALMRPMTGGGQAGETVFVFDVSASMQTETDGQSRMEQAVYDARRRVDGMADGARISILTAGAQVRQPLTRSTDRVAAQRALASLRAENGGADIEGACSLAKAMEKELEGVQLVVYTDQTLSNMDAVQPRIGRGEENRALLSLQAEGTSAVARVANYGKAGAWTLECTADGALCDVRTVTLEEGETGSVALDVPEGAREVSVHIVQPDALALDNLRYWTRRETSQTTIVLAGRDNIFLEKALSLREDVTLLKTSLAEAAQLTRGALTVIDGPLPDTLPTQGALLLIDPDREAMGVTPGARVQVPASLRAAQGTLSEQLNTYVQVEDIQVAKYRPLEGVGTPIWLADGQPVLRVAQQEGRRMAVLGFDLHDANLPLLKEFPIWMQRLLDYLAPEPVQTAQDGDCGEPLRITPQSFAQSVRVRTPSGRTVELPVTGGMMTDTQEMGAYTLIQTDEAGGAHTTRFALHMPRTEGDVRIVAMGAPETTKTNGGTAYGREWTGMLIALLLALLLVEWGVYRRGY